MKYEGKKRKKEKCLKENTINEHIIFIKWWTLIAPLADERRMWVFSKENKIGRDEKDRIFL